LFYCKKKGVPPQGIINLHGCTVTPLPQQNRGCSFSLLAHKSVSVDAQWINRTYYISAKDEAEMKVWMDLITGASEAAVMKAQQKTNGSATGVVSPTTGSEAPKMEERKEEKQPEKKEEIKEEMKVEMREVKEEAIREDTMASEVPEKKKKKKKKSEGAEGTEKKKKKKKEKREEGEEGEKKKKKKKKEKKKKKRMKNMK